jgi:hypothetical protein
MEYTWSDWLALQEERFLAEQEAKLTEGLQPGCPIHYNTTEGCGYCTAIVEMYGLDVG